MVNGEWLTGETSEENICSNCESVARCQFQEGLAQKAHITIASGDLSGIHFFE